MSLIKPTRMWYSAIYVNSLLALFILTGVGFSLFSANADAGAKLLSLGSSYKYYPEANYPYTKDPGDAVQLTDGLKSSGTFWKSRKAVGWKNSGNITIEMSLDGQFIIEKICIRMARGSHAGVSFPDAIDVFISLDNELYSYIGDMYEPGNNIKGKYKVNNFCINASIAGEFITFKIRPSGEFGYTFIDEIEVYGEKKYNNNPSFYTAVDREDITSFVNSKRDYVSRKHALINLANSLYENSENITNNLINDLVKEIEQDNSFSISRLKGYEKNILEVNQQLLEPAFSDPLIIWHRNPWENHLKIDVPKILNNKQIGLNFELFQNSVAVDAFVITNTTNKDIVVDLVMESATQPSDVLPEVSIGKVIPVISSEYKYISDAIEPTALNKIRVSSGESLQLWVNVLTNDVKPGSYLSTINVRYGESGTNKRVPLNITIHPGFSNSEDPFYVNVWSYLNSRLIADNMVSAINDLNSHNVNVAILHPTQIPWPKKSSDGDWYTDFSQIDKYMTYIKESKKLLIFMNFNNSRVRDFGGKRKFGTANWSFVLKKWVIEFNAYLKNHGLNSTDYAFYPVDEPVGHEVDILLRVAKEIKAIDKNIKIYTTLTRNPGPFLEDELHKYIDIFQLNNRFMPVFSEGLIDRYNVEYWLYVAHGGGKHADPLKHYRMLAWHAFFNNMNGIGFWSYADIGPKGNSWNDLDGVRPDFAVVYEIGDKVIGSKRWDAWMLGVEDYRLLYRAKSLLRTPDASSRFNKIISDVYDSSDIYRAITIARSQLFMLIEDIVSENY